MPRGTRDTVDEPEASKTLRRAVTRAAAAGNATDSPVRRSTRFSKQLTTVDSSPESLADSEASAATTTGRTTRSRAATLDKGTAAAASKNTRSRKNSVSSDHSDMDETLAQKRLTRRASTSQPATATPTKTLRPRNVRAGSESKSTPPVTRTKRVTRASSVDPLGNESTGTPVRRRTRASIVPVEPTVEEEQVAKSQPAKSLEDTTIQEDDFETSDTEKSSSRTSKTSKEIEKQLSAVSKDMSNDSGKSSLGSSKKLEESLTDKSSSLTEIVKTTESPLKTFETQSSKSTLEPFITALDNSAKKCDTMTAVELSSDLCYQSIKTESNTSVSLNDLAKTSSNSVSIITFNESNESEIIDVEEIGVPEEIDTFSKNKHKHCTENPEPLNVDIKDVYVKLNRVEQTIEKECNSDIKESELNEDAISQSNVIPVVKTAVALMNDCTEEVEDKFDNLAQKNNVEETLPSSTETRDKVEFPKNSLNAKNIIVVNVDNSDDDDFYQLSVDDNDEEEKSVPVVENQTEPKKLPPVNIAVVNPFSKLNREKDESSDVGNENENLTIIPNKEINDQSNFILNDNKTVNNDDKEDTFLTNANDNELNTSDKENMMAMHENEKVSENFLDKQVNISSVKKNESKDISVSDKHNLISKQNHDETEVPNKVSKVKNLRPIEMTVSDEESDNLSIIAEINSFLNGSTTSSQNTKDKSDEENSTAANENKNENEVFEMEIDNQSISDKDKESIDCLSVNDDQMNTPEKSSFNSDKTQSVTLNSVASTTEKEIQSPLASSNIEISSKSVIDIIQRPENAGIRSKIFENIYKVALLKQNIQNIVHHEVECLTISDDDDNDKIKQLISPKNQNIHEIENKDKNETEIFESVNDDRDDDNINVEKLASATKNDQTVESMDIDENIESHSENENAAKTEELKSVDENNSLMKESVTVFENKQDIKDLKEEQKSIIKIKKLDTVKENNIEINDSCAIIENIDGPEKSITTEQIIEKTSEELVSVDEKINDKADELNSEPIICESSVTTDQASIIINECSGNVKNSVLIEKDVTESEDSTSLMQLNNEESSSKLVNEVFDGLHSSIPTVDDSVNNVCTIDQAEDALNVEMPDSVTNNTNNHMETETYNEPVSNDIIINLDNQESEQIDNCSLSKSDSNDNSKHLLLIAASTESDSNYSDKSGVKDKNSVSSAVTDNGGDETKRPNEEACEKETTPAKKTPVKEQEVKTGPKSKPADSDLDSIADELFQDIPADEWSDKKSTSLVKDDGDETAKKRQSRSSVKQQNDNDDVNDSSPKLNKSLSKSRKSLETKKNDHSESPKLNGSAIESTEADGNADENASFDEEKPVNRSIKESNVSRQSLNSSVSSRKSDRNSLNKSRAEEKEDESTNESEKLSASLNSSVASRKSDRKSLNKSRAEEKEDESANESEKLSASLNSSVSSRKSDPKFVNKSRTEEKEDESANESEKLSASLNSSVASRKSDRKSLNKSQAEEKEDEKLSTSLNESKSSQKKSSTNTSRKSLNSSAVEEMMEVDDESNSEAENLKANEMSFNESQSNKSINKSIDKSVFDQSVSKNKSLLNKSSSSVSRKSLEKASIVSSSSNDEEQNEPLNNSNKSSAESSFSSKKEKSFKETFNKSLNKSLNKSNVSFKNKDDGEIEVEEMEIQEDKVSESLNVSKKSLRSAKNTPIKASLTENDDKSTLKLSSKKNNGKQSEKELDMSLLKNIERMKYANPLKPDFSMVAEVGSDSDDADDLPSFIFKQADLDAQSRESDDDGESDNDDNEDDSNNSINPDIAMEYNLSGKKRKSEDADIPGVSLSTEEEEYSDSEDDGSDLDDFIVSDNDTEESESEDDKVDVIAEDESEEDEVADEEEIEEEQVVDEYKVKKDKNKSINQSFDSQGTSKKDVREKSFNDSKIKKDETLDSSKSIKIKSDVSLNLAKNKSAKASMLNISSASKSAQKVGEGAHESSNVSLKSVKDKSMNLSKTSKNKSQTTLAQTKLVDSSSEDDEDEKTGNTPYESETEPGEDSYRIITVKSHGKLEKSKKKLASGIESSTPIVATESQNWPWLRYSTLNQTTQIAGDETPTTKFLKKSKLNDSFPILESMKSNGLEEKRRLSKSWQVENAENVQQINKIEEQKNETEQEVQTDVPKSVKKSKKRKLIDMSLRESVEDDSILKEVTNKKKRARVEELAALETKEDLQNNESTESTEGKKKKKKNKKNKSQVTEVNGNELVESSQGEVNKSKKKKKKKAQEVEIELSEELAAVSAFEVAKQKKQKKKPQEVQVEEEPPVNGAEKSKKKKKKSLDAEEIIPAEIETETAVESEKQKKKKKNKKSLDAQEVEPAREEPEAVTDSEKKKKKKKRNKSLDTEEAVPMGVEVETIAELEKPKKKKKKKKKSLDVQETMPLEQEEEVAVELEKPKKKKKKRSSGEMSNQENLSTENVEQSKKEKLSSSTESKKSEKKSKKKNKSEVPLNNDDEAPESVDFSEARRVALEKIKQMEDNAKAQKLARKKKRKVQENSDSSSKSLKRLSEDFLEKLTDESTSRPIKRQKLSENAERKIIVSSPSKVPPNVKVDDGYIPLSSVGGTTQFGVVQMQKAHKVAKTNEKVLNFREKMLSRNPRIQAGSYLVYSEKLKAKNQNQRA